MDQKELIRSVKSVLARLQSFGVSKEDIRNLLVLLFLLRWLRDEMNSFADFSREREHLELADRLNEIFSPNVRFREVHQNVYESVNLLRYYFNNENIRELDLSTKNYLFRDRRVVIEAINWLREWGELRLDRRKYVSQLFEVILKETRTPQTAQFSSSTLLSKLIVAIAAPKNGETILDPCVGEGGFLIAAHNTIEASDTDFLSQTSFTGYDLSEDAILIAMVRFYLSGGLNFRLNKRNGLYYTYGSEPELQYDIVLAQPPVGIKSEEYRHLARRRQFPVETNDIVGMFIQQSIHYLKPSGRAIVAVPEGVLFGKNRSQIDLRRFLVEYGYLEAVVRIPPKTLIEDSEIRGALLLLSNSKKRPRKVRFADLSSYIHQGNNKSNQVLPDVLVDQIIERLFCEELPEAIPLPPGMKEGTIGTGVSTRAFWDVSIDEIRRKNWDLSPIRNVDDALTLLLIDFKQLMGDEVKIDNLSKIAQINTGKSVRSTEQTVEETPYGYIRIRDVEDFKIQRFTTWLQEDLAHAYSDNQLYKGNILISKTGTIGKLALVDEKGVGAFAGNNFYILRINPAKVLPEYLLYYLSSSFCQDWLDSRKRGAVQQHINIDVIKTVPILLPSFEMQKRAVAQYDQHGTDVITFLKENSQRSDEKVIEHLVDMMEMEVASFDSNITSIEKSVTLLSEISLKLLSIDGAIDELNSHQRVWYSNVSSILIVLRDINKIPPGPVLLNILQDAKEQVGLLSEVLAGNYNLEERLLRVFGYVQAQIDRCIDMILANVRVLVSSSVGELEKNSDVEFSISLDNQGFLPLKNIVVETYPNLGIGDNYYLADHTSMEVPLSCKTTDKDRLSFTVMWRAETLAGRLLSGSSELAIKLVQFNEEFENFDTASNPYVTGSPLEPENGALVFYGRESFIQQVIRQIEGNGNVILLEGNRRAGKTSILKHLEGSNTIPNWLVVYSSLQGAEGASDKVGVPTVEVFREMARSIASAIAKMNIDVPLPDGKVIFAGKPALGVARSCKAGIGEDSPFIDFRDYLEVLLTLLEDKQLGIVLMLDEFDKLQEGIDNGVTSPQLPENIRYLIQNYSRFSAILTGSRRLKRLREEYWSALYGLGTNLIVSALDKSSAEKIVVEPVKEYIAYSREAVELILSLTSKQPYLIQKICNRIFDYAVRNIIHSIKSNDVKLIADELIVADEHFASLWDYAYRGPSSGGYRRQALLCVLSSYFANEALCTFGMLEEYLVQSAIDVKDYELEADIAYLRELELVSFFGENGTGYYKVEIPLMAMWINYHQDSEIVLKNALNEDGSNDDK